MAKAGLLVRLEHGIFPHEDFERMDEVEFIRGYPAKFLMDGTICGLIGLRIGGPFS
jgi:hypothetical protein